MKPQFYLQIPGGSYYALQPQEATRILNELAAGEPFILFQGAPFRRHEVKILPMEVNNQWFDHGFLQSLRTTNALA